MVNEHTSDTNPDQNSNTPIHPVKLSEIYSWALRLTSEDGWEKDYLWRPETQSLVYRLSTVRGQLIAITGLQGTGKTALRSQLANNIQDSLNVKWNGAKTISQEIEKRRSQLLIGEDDLRNESYHSLVLEEFYRKCRVFQNGGSQNIMHSALKIKAKDEILYNVFAVLDTWLRKKQVKDIYKLLDDLELVMPRIEKYLGKQTINKIKKKCESDELESVSTILIDLPDYDKHSKRQVNKDLRDIHAWWDEAARNNYDSEELPLPNIVMFYQEELWKEPHFFKGKFQVIKLKPFSSEKLISHFKNKFGAVHPFTEDSLAYIVKLARGTFRWYKKYIAKCLDHMRFNSLSIIDVEDVRACISDSQLLEDWDRELHNVFPKSHESRHSAVMVLRFLQENGESRQSVLIHKFYGSGKDSDMRCGRLLSKLESFDYLERELVGREKVVRLLVST